MGVAVRWPWPAALLALVFAACGPDLPPEGAPTWLEATIDGRTLRFDRNGESRGGLTSLKSGPQMAFMARASTPLEDGKSDQLMLYLFGGERRMLAYDDPGPTQVKNVTVEVIALLDGVYYRTSGVKPTVTISHDGMLVQGAFTASLRRAEHGRLVTDAPDLLIEGTFQGYRNDYLDYEGANGLEGGLMRPCFASCQSPFDQGGTYSSDDISDNIRGLTLAALRGTWQLYRDELFFPDGNGDTDIAGMPETTRVFLQQPGIVYEFGEAKARRGDLGETAWTDEALGLEDRGEGARVLTIGRPDHHFNQWRIYYYAPPDVLVVALLGYDAGDGREAMYLERISDGPMP